MFLEPTLLFKKDAEFNLNALAEALQQQIPDVRIAAFNSRLRPTELSDPKLAQIKLYDGDAEKFYMRISTLGADIRPKSASQPTVKQSIEIVSDQAKVKTADPMLGGLCSLAFLVLFPFVFVGQMLPRSEVLAFISVLSVLFITIGMLLLGIQATKFPYEGRSNWSLAFLIAGQIVLVPMSLLNIPLTKYFMQRQAEKLVEGS
ncbi:hypothetical protein [Marinobacter mobilis]|uniref:hypothetical protein n=1 Tax=Marinobacter mobilis TaxID=488533 RepID=UPI0035C6683A